MTAAVINASKLKTSSRDIISTPFALERYHAAVLESATLLGEPIPFDVRCLLHSGNTRLDIRVPLIGLDKMAVTDRARRRDVS
jgi:hypothetical protein